MARPTVPILLSPEQQALLQALTRSREAPHRLVQRAQIVLSASAGKPNKAIGQDLGLCEETVGLWRQRWLQGSAALVKLEHQPRRLRQAVGQLLADQPRPGCPDTFTAEQVCQILAVACERPPEQFSHWTRQELVREVTRRGIVERISATSIGRFLKSGGFKTASGPLLAEP